MRKDPLIDPKLLEILACPYCKAEIHADGDMLKCCRAECGLAYKVEDGIPIMLVEEASRPCPKCGADRAFTDEQLVCGACGAVYRYEPGKG